MKSKVRILLHRPKFDGDVGSMKRLDYDADTKVDIQRYFSTRGKQLMVSGFHIHVRSMEKHADGYYKVRITKAGNNYRSIYIPTHLRGQGLIRKAISENDTPFVTTHSCGVEDVFDKFGADYIVTAKHTEWPEYKYIQKYYGDDCANRSGLFLMNHIDEGLAVFNYAEHATENAMRAFCLHPIFQDYNKGIEKAKTYRDGIINDIIVNTSRYVSDAVLALAEEYARIADSFLLGSDLGKFPVSGVSEEVKYMLLVDKVQNYKDFRIWHLGTHPKSDELEEYFNNWLKLCYLDGFFKEKLWLDYNEMISNLIEFYNGDRFTEYKAQCTQAYLNHY